jgi:hypothetical protein
MGAMTSLARSMLLCALGLALTACLQPESAPPAVDDDSTTIAAWIDDHRAALPTDYDELGHLPWPYRRALVMDLPHPTQSVLVQTHLARYLVAHSELTPAQREGIAAAQEVMTPTWFAMAPMERQRVGEEELEPLMGAFDHAELIRIFATVGPEDAAIRKLYAPPDADE